MAIGTNLQSRFFFFFTSYLRFTIYALRQELALLPGHPGRHAEGKNDDLRMRNASDFRLPTSDL